MTRLLAIGLLLCVVLAGCGGGAGTGTVTDTATNASTDAPTDTPTATPTATTEPSEYLATRDLPDGLSAEALTNASDLVEVHRSNVEAEGAEVTFSTAVSTGQQSTSTNITARYGADGSFAVERVSKTRARETGVRAYFNGSTTFVEQRSQGASYSVVDSEIYADQFRTTNALKTYLRLGNFSVDAVDREAGTVTLVATGPGDAELFGQSTPENVSGRLVVGLDGTIREYGIGMDLRNERQETTTSLEIDYELTTRGVESVSEPGWVDTAREEAIVADLSFEVVDDTVRITHEGGDAVPAGSRIIVSAQPESGEAGRTMLASFNDSFEPGDTASLYLEEGKRFRGTLERGTVSPDDAVSLSGTATVRVTFQGRVITLEQFTINGTSA